MSEKVFADAGVGDAAHIPVVQEGSYLRLMWAPHGQVRFPYAEAQTASLTINMPHILQIEVGSASGPYLWLLCTEICSVSEEGWYLRLIDLHLRLTLTNRLYNIWQGGSFVRLIDLHCRLTMTFRSIVGKKVFADAGVTEVLLSNGRPPLPPNPQPSTINHQPFTLTSHLSTLNPQSSTLLPQTSTFNHQP